MGVRGLVEGLLKSMAVVGERRCGRGVSLRSH